MTRHARISRALADVSRVRSALDRINQALETVLEGDVDASFNAVSGMVAPGLEYRRDHRPGRAAKIDCDLELRAFIVARIDTMTFEELAREVAIAFPSERRVRKTAIHQWWRRNMGPKSER